MSKKTPLARKGQKRRKAPIIILIAVIVAAVGGIASFLILTAYNTPNTLTEKLTRVLHDKPYDEIEQYYRSTDDSHCLGYSWKNNTEKTSSRIVFFENETGFVKMSRKDRSAVDIINEQTSDKKDKKETEKKAEKPKKNKDFIISDGKHNITIPQDNSERVYFNWSIDEGSKTLTLKFDTETLEYSFVSDPDMKKSEFKKQDNSKWIVTSNYFAFGGYIFSAPDKATFWSTLKDNFNSTFIVEDRWQSLLQGLGITLLIALFSTLLGLLLGFLLAIIRSTYDMTLKGRFCYKPGEYVLKALNVIANIYITIIRGTPVVVQLMIMYFIIFASWDNAILAAILAFGINSGAYVAEIVRSGIMSIDKGQFEASRSLGFDYKHTMISIILPQALKNVLPALGNEFIVLLKETSVAGYVAIVDLTKASDIIRSRTYEPFFPLITIAIIYLILVLILSFFLKKLERRLRNSDH